MTVRIPWDDATIVGVVVEHDDPTQLHGRKWVLVEPVPGQPQLVNVAEDSILDAEGAVAAEGDAALDWAGMTDHDIIRPVLDVTLDRTVTVAVTPTTTVDGQRQVTIDVRLLDDDQNLTSQTLVEIERFIRRGVMTNLMTREDLPDDLQHAFVLVNVGVREPAAV